MEDVQQAPSQAPSDYVSEASFDELGLSEPLRRAVAERGYTKPTPVQTASYRPIRDGKDVIVRSKTGTGKTAAFAIPILERIADGRRKASALVMCPTRELALQVAEEMTALARHKDLTVVTVYGGASIGDQKEKLEAGAEVRLHPPQDAPARRGDGLLPRRGGRDAQHGVLRGGHEDPRSSPGRL